MVQRVMLVLHVDLVVRELGAVGRLEEPMTAGELEELEEPRSAGELEELRSSRCPSRAKSAARWNGGALLRRPHLVKLVA